MPAPRSSPMVGRATLTTVVSRKAMPDPSTVASRTQRPVGLRERSPPASAAGGRGHVEDGGVEEGEPRPEHRGQQDPAAGGAAVADPPGLGGGGQRPLPLRRGDRPTPWGAASPPPGRESAR